MAALLAESFGVSSSNSDNTNQILAAISAAANENTQVIFPAGDLKFSQDLVLPKGFVGCLSIAGLGKKITRFIPTTNCNGFNFDLSAGTAANNSVSFSNFGLVSSAGIANTAISISYGTGSLGSVENQDGSSIESVSVRGGNWVNGISLTNCWHADVNGLYLYGGGAYTTNNGIGISVNSCFNTIFNRITAEFFSKGATIKSMYSVGGDSQGIFFDNIHFVETIEGFHLYGTPGGALSTVYITNWMVDNGNLNVPTHRSIVFDNAEDCVIGIGQGLQNGGDSQIIFNNCRGCDIDPKVSLEFRANTTGPAIQNNNGNGNDIGTSISKLINISTRGFVGAGANIMTAGFVIGGTIPKTVLIRATGPSLSIFGVAGILPDPKLQLFSSAGVLLASNVVWGGSSQISAAASSVGAFAWPATSKDSAILVTLQPGNYTAEVSGNTNDTGDALVEVYDVS